MTTDKTPPKSSKVPRVNLKDLKKLIDMMKKAELSEVNIEQEGLKVNLKKDEKPPSAGSGQAVVQMMPMQAAPQHVMQAAPVQHAAPAPASAAPAPAADGNTIDSPMVGTFYRSSSPDSQPFAKEGQKVEVGQTLCIIEAMKLMNEIKAEAAGTLLRFCVENAQPVEYGQPLYIIKP